MELTPTTHSILRSAQDDGALRPWGSRRERAAQGDRALPGRPVAEFRLLRHPAPVRGSHDVRSRAFHPRGPSGRSGNMLSMRNLALVACCAIATMAPIRRAAAQVAGETTLGVTVEELKLVVLGWSVKKQMLGQDVRNDKNENIGDVEDVIVSPKKTVSWALIGVGGFLGVGEK